MNDKLIASVTGANRGIGLEVCRQLPAELRGSRILVNSVCPGWTATYPGAAEQGARPVAEGAASVVWAATLPDSGPSGGFFRDGQRLSW